MLQKYKYPEDVCTSTCICQCVLESVGYCGVCVSILHSCSELQMGHKAPIKFYIFDNITGEQNSILSLTENDETLCVCMLSSELLGLFLVFFW